MNQELRRPAETRDTMSDDPAKRDSNIRLSHRIGRRLFPDRYARRTESQHAGTSSSLVEYRAWKDSWWLARHLLSVGVMVVWGLLTALVSWQVLQAFNKIADGERVVLVGTFLAWMTVTTAIQKSLKPHRAKEHDSGDESLAERVASLIEKAAKRSSDG